MERNNIDKQCRLVLLLLATCVSMFCGQEQDSCANERNCSVQLSNSNVLHCTVGHTNECNSVMLSRTAPVISTRELYPYLATISVYKRSYGSDFHVEAFNFSFIVPPSDIAGVMAEFGEAPGYHNNSYYKVPICRFFKFLDSSLISTLGTQLEIPYNCIGIGIIPSVFHLNLTSVSSWHSIHYVVSWNEHLHDEQGYFNYFYEDPGTTKSVWVEQVIAIAVVEQKKLIHVVFQPPSSQAGIGFLKVSLIRQFKLMMFKEIGLNESSVIFINLPPGQYQVIVSPQDGACSLEHNLCTDIASEYISIGQDGDTDYSTDVIMITPVLVVIVIIVLVVAGVVALMIRRKLRKTREMEISSIFITSMARRDLEKHVTSYFCSFLSVALQTNVTFTLPLLQPDRPTFINAGTVNHEADTRQRLLVQTSTLHKFFNCCIILQFSYPTKRCELNGATCGSESHLSDIHLDTLGHRQMSSIVLREVMHKIPSEQAYFVTFKKENHSADTEVAYTIQEGSENGGNSDDHITVLNGTIRRTSQQNAISMCNRFDGCSHEISHQNVKEYSLPCDISNLYEDLRSRLPFKAMYTPFSEVTRIKHWRLAVAMFHKAAENQPGHTCDIHGQITSDVLTLAENIHDRGYLHNNQQKPSYSISERSSSEDSYSNVTEAKWDMQLNSPQSQCHRNVEVTKMTETLSNGYRSYVPNDAFNTEDNTLHISLFHYQEQVQHNKSTIGYTNFSPQYSKTSDYESGNIIQTEVTQSSWKTKNTARDSSVFRDDHTTRNMFGSDCSDTFIYSVHADISPASSDHPLVYSDKSESQMGTSPARVDAHHAYVNQSPARADAHHAYVNPSLARADAHHAYVNPSPARADAHHAHVNPSPEHRVSPLVHKDTSHHFDTSSPVCRNKAHAQIYTSPACGAPPSVDRNTQHAHRHTSPDNRYTSPDNRYTSPDNRHTSPDNRHTSPDSRHASPDNRHTSPDNRHTSPDNRYTSPDNRHTSSDNRHTSHDNRHTSPDNRHTSSDNRHTSSDNRHTSPDNRHTSSDNRHTSSDNRHTSSDNRHTSSDNRHTFSDNKHTSPDNRHTSSDNRHTSSDNRNTSPDNRHASPDNRHTSPDNRHTSSDNRNTSPDNRHTSSDNRHTSPDNRHASHDNRHTFTALIHTVPSYKISLPDNRKNRTFSTDNDTVGDGFEECKNKLSPISKHKGYCNNCPVWFENSLIPPEML